MDARFGLAQLELRAPRDDTAAMIEELGEHVAQGQLARPALMNRQHDEAVALLQLGMLVELVEHDLRLGVALELDHDAHAVAIGLIAQIADALDALVVHQLGDALDDVLLDDLVGNLADDDRRAPATLVGLDASQRAHRQDAAPVHIDFANLLLAQQLPASRKIRPRDEVEDLLHRERGLLDHREQRIAHLGQVVRRNVGRHPDRDAIGAVDQKIRNLTREKLGLLIGAVVVGLKIDGVLVDIGQHPLGDAGEARLGVAIRRGRVTIDGAEISLAVHQRIAERERLRHPHQRIVNRHVAVRMELLEHLADHAGALGMLAVGEQAFAEHRIEDASMDGLEAVANIGQRAPDIHRHRVVQVGLAHIGFDVQEGGFVVWGIAVGLCHYYEVPVLIPLP